ncbi:hypothetical protein [Porphyrobacter sp. YT40]|uniref:hypothetical protein n=1 Tax=Porphyrobacter sp. YT40 TaxID=2547601 RepID=UPI001143E3A1|nr:hypothetical protein [Porphyrobacter sp. YT40]QDH35935.1 hypothetical protein E2E27_17360 [Porphyrobacter sp. YT40]
MIRLAPLAVLALALAACGDEAAPAAQQGGAASGEVLEGSISDAMIPLDQVTSQAPLAPRQAAQASDLDAEQPEVEPAPGINDAPASEAAEAAPAAPAPAE